ncbi:hypothetical protein [Treponema endosymbiont of Eucomonympha sp.]|uniref:hypothetical protein n=1 Tax=Treponema endosymbiont of Eucomonympha sp. TaxID=1580831 RepID=UPI00078290B7|nr:hypothetical protein [Treponema endosymbiont of Eucomonympha sp.]
MKAKFDFRYGWALEPEKEPGQIQIENLILDNRQQEFDFGSDGAEQSADAAAQKGSDGEQS